MGGAPTSTSGPPSRRRHRAITAENQRAVELAGIRLRVGSGDLRAVLQQQLALYSARSALLRVQSEQRLQRINLHLALGGGFPEPPQRSAGIQYR